MSEWKAKRFWSTAEVAETEAGYGVSLDGRPVKTPAKRLLVAPTRDLAQAVAAEWQAQDDVIDPNSMPFTHAVNAALDKVAVAKGGGCRSAGRLWRQRSALLQGRDTRRAGGASGGGLGPFPRLGGRSAWRTARAAQRG